jgi:hypothetical protein
MVSPLAREGKGESEKLVMELQGGRASPDFMPDFMC